MFHKSIFYLRKSIFMMWKSTSSREAEAQQAEAQQAEARQDKAWQAEAQQAESRQAKWQTKAWWQAKAWQAKAWQAKAQQAEARQAEAWQAEAWRQAKAEARQAKAWRQAKPEARQAEAEARQAKAEAQQAEAEARQAEARQHLELVIKHSQKSALERQGTNLEDIYIYPSRVLGGCDKYSGPPTGTIKQRLDYILGECFEFDTHKSDHWFAAGFALIEVTQALCGQGLKNGRPWPNRREKVPKYPRDYLALAMGCITRCGTIVSCHELGVSDDEYCRASEDYKLCSKLADQVKEAAKGYYIKTFVGTGPNTTERLLVAFTAPTYRIRKRLPYEEDCEPGSRDA